MEEIEIQAIELEHFIRRYTPKFWKETIGTVCFVPLVLHSDYLKMRTGEVPERFDKWYFKEAIKKFFEKTP